MITCSGCHRHIHAKETACPFCGTELRVTSGPTSTLGALVVMAMVVCGSFGCATNPEAEEGNTVTTTSVSATETVGDTSTQESSESEGEGVETDDPPDTSLSFYAPPSDFSGVSECDPFQQDCPEGEKCVPYASTGENWDANKCVPISGTGTTGEACVSGGIVEATDDCDGEHFCWDEVCTPFCEGTPDVPECDPGSACLISNEGSITLCIDTCDPLASDCPDPLVCAWAGFGFVCAEEAPGLGGIGEDCSQLADCSPGAVCLSDEVLSGCESTACCAELCDTSQMDYPCVEAGLTCQAFYNDPPEGYENVGVCIDPG